MVNEGFLNADQNVWQAMINRAVSGRDPVSHRLIDEFAESEDFSEVLFEIESLAAPTTRSARGRAHSPDESFERVNATYFNGWMPKPILVWNRTFTARKVVHY